MRAASVVLTLVTLHCSLAAPAFAAWPQDPYSGGVAVTTATNGQFAPISAPDGTGGLLVTWQDVRAGGSYDIYAQRVSAAGVPLWTANGVAVCTATNNQYAPQVVSDGSGGAIVAWFDVRVGSDYDVYIQRVSAAGAVQWTANGVAVCALSGNQSLPQLVSDGAGGAIVTWEDSRSSVTVYAQRFNAAGTPQWTANGVALCTASGGQSAPQIAPDGAGGAVIAWEDLRSLTSFDVYAQRLNASGVAQWTANGVALCTATGDQDHLQCVSDGAGGAVVAWIDARSGGDDLYARRILSTGVAQWGTNGVALCIATGDQAFLAAVPDGSGGIVAAWTDLRSGAYDVYAQRLSAAGAALWAANGFAVCTATGNQTGPAIVADGTGGAIIAWPDSRSAPDADLYAQRVSGAGAGQWTSNGIAVSLANGGQSEPTAVPDGAGGALVAFMDERLSTSDDIFAQRVQRFGQLGSPEPAITQVKDVTGDQGGAVKVSWTASYLDADPTFGVTDYRVWRSVPVTGAAARALLARGVTSDPDAAAAGDAFLVMPAAAQDYAWELSGTQAAALLPGYSFVAATTRDSLGGSNPRTAFMVEARQGTSITADRWFSAPDSGYSVDNLAPATPAPFTGTYSAGTARLAWNPNHETDLEGYRLYRGTSTAFVPGPGNLVSAQPDTGFVDAAGAPYVYKLTAVDAHGNESPVAMLIPSGALAVDGGAVPHAYFALGSANPARGGERVTFRLGLAGGGAVRVALYDAGGRLVRSLANGTRAAGEHALAWDGRDEAGRAVAPGLYFARAEAPGLAVTRKFVVQD